MDDAVLSFPDRFGNVYVNGIYYPYTAQSWNGMTVRGSFLLYNTTNPSAVNLHSSALFVYGDSADTLAASNAVSTTVTLYGPVSITTARTISPFLSLGANWTGTIATYQTFTSFFPHVAAGASGTITNYQAYEAGGSVTAGVNITNSRLYRCSSPGGGTAINSCFSAVEKTGATNNAAFHIDSNSATCGAGLVAGTAFDTCLYRGRAGAWTGPAGTDIYTDSGYICAGTGCSSVTSTATGVYDAGVRVMSSVSCTGATCSLTNGALSVAVSGGGSGSFSGSFNVTGTLNFDDTTAVVSRANGNGSPASPLTVTMCDATPTASVAGNGRLRGSLEVTFCTGDIAAGNSILATITGFSGLTTSHVLHVGISQPRTAFSTPYITSSPFVITPIVRTDTQVIEINLRAAIALTTTGSTKVMLAWHIEEWTS